MARAKRNLSEAVDHGGVVGFDSYGKLEAMSWIDPERGLTEKMAMRFCAKGGLATRKVTTEEMRALMIEHGFVKP